MDDYDGLKNLQNIRIELQGMQRRNRELIWQCSKRLKEPLSPDEREDVEQDAFEAMQRLQMANEEMERLEEDMAHLRQLQEKGYPERTDLGTIILICIFFLLIVFLLSRYEDTHPFRSAQDCGIVPGVGPRKTNAPRVRDPKGHW